MMVKTLAGRSRGWLASVLVLFVVSIASAQTFNSGSDESDGALNLTTPGTYIFDPKDSATFGRVLDPDGDGVFNFTTITIGTGVTVKFAGDRYNRPVFWLATGAVQINGALDLNGADGAISGSDLNARRKVAVPGSGGYAGGAGGQNIVIPATDGEGPGGGAGAALACTSVFCVGQDGVFTGNRFLVPLFGGSGGGERCIPV